MTGNHETYMKILEKSLDEQSKRYAEICYVFLQKFGADKMFSKQLFQTSLKGEKLK